ncbi:MAG: hypothetical protein HY431_02230 [Candidatus Levybacteria bacterium]|nr:hypothetical protein [Candidatus Levybacteria bacterium]
MIRDTIYKQLINYSAATIFFIFVVLVSFHVGSAQDTDFWWHLALGKWELAMRSFLLTDIFSYTFSGQQWFNNTQLFDVPLYLLYSSLGTIGLYMIRLVVYTVSFFFLYKAASLTKAPKLLIFSLFIPSLLMLRQFARPEITLPLFVAFYLYALYGFQYRNSKLIYTLPLVQVLWVNVNGGYVFGLFIIAVFLGSEILRSLIQNHENVLLVLKNKVIRAHLVVALLSFFALFVSPYGFSILKWLLFYFGPQKVTAQSPPLISEFEPLSLHQFLDFGYATPYKLLLILLASVLIYRSVVKIKKADNLYSFLQRLNYEDLIISGYLFYLSVQHNRFMSIFAFVAPLMILKNIDFPHPARNYRWQLFPFLASVAVFTMLYPIFTTTFSYPQESIQFMRAQAVQGPLFHTYELGGYLIATLYPDHKVFIDGRTPNLYDNNFFWYYRHLENPNIFNAVAEKYQFNAIILHTASGFARPVIDSKQWALVFFDNESIVLLKENEQNKELIARFRYRLLDPTRKVDNYLNVCEKPRERDILLEEIKRNTGEVSAPFFSAVVFSNLTIKCADTKDADVTTALSLLEKAIKTRPTGEVYYTMGALQIRLNKEEEALKNFKKSIRIQKNSFNMTGLGTALYNLGRFQDAERVLRRIPFLPDGDNPPNEYYQVYGRVSYQLNNPRKALELFGRYDALVGEDNLIAQDYLDLSLAYRDSGDMVKAQEYLQRSKQGTPPDGGP